MAARLSAIGLMLFCSAYEWAVWIVVPFAAWMVADVILVHASIAFVTKEPEDPLRSVTLGILGYVTLVTGFAVFFSELGEYFGPALGRWTAFYFSFVTATTLGYGDFQPLDGAWWVQALVVLEVILAVFFVAGIIATFVGWSRNEGGEPGVSGSMSKPNA